MAKLGRRVFDGVYVHEPGLQAVKELTQNRRCRVVLMPMFKSFNDPLVLHQIKYLDDLEMGFTFAQIEDTPKLKAIELLLRRAGCFLIKRRQAHNNIVNYVNQSLLHDVIEDNQITTIFQNDERPRSGKFSVPQHPDYMIKLLIKTFNQIQNKNIFIVPVNICHDRVLDITFM